MSHTSAYMQLLTLVGARSQQWLRNRIALLPTLSGSDHRHLDGVAEIAVTASICSAYRGTAIPLETFIRDHFTSEFVAAFVASYGDDPRHDRRGNALFRFLPPQSQADIILGQPVTLLDRLSLAHHPDADLLAEVQAFLRTPVSPDLITEQVIDTYARILSLSYRFGEERPRFADVRTYGDAFATCLRFADWAERKGRLMPLAQMCYCLCLIDPDHDVAPLLADVLSSQRPDGSFPHRIGFGTADQGNEALGPTLAVLIALHMAVHRRWRCPQPPLPLAA